MRRFEGVQSPNGLQWAVPFLPDDVRHFHQRTLLTKLGEKANAFSDIMREFTVLSPLGILRFLPLRLKAQSKMARDGRQSKDAIHFQ